MRPRVPGCAFVLLALAFCASAADPWAVPDAPLRAVVGVKKAPELPEAGYLIELPELGQTMKNLDDVVLADAKGNVLPLAKIWRGEGQKVLLLAQALAAGQNAYVYFGGNRARRQSPWNPKTSLLLETRRLPGSAKLDDAAALESAWKAAGDVDGADFVPQIAQGANPFGDSANFLSHYTGWLKTDGKKVTLYTLSSDASFVFVNGRPEFGWPGEHGAHANAKDVAQKEVDTQAGATRVEYFHAAKRTPQPAMVLGWMKDGKSETIPASAWIHPGATSVEKVEHMAGWPSPLGRVVLLSYIGWEDLWLYRVQASLASEPPAGWKVDWAWSDGATSDGMKSERVIAGPAPVYATARIKGEKGEVRGSFRVSFGGAPPPQVETQNEGALHEYLALLDREEPAKLAPGTLRAGFMLLAEFGNDQQIGKWAAAWIAKNPGTNDPLWAKGQVARLRALAQSDPKGALAELHRFDSATWKKHAQELGLCELDIMVFHLKDPAAVPTANRIAFENPNTDLARIAKIRTGDLYRLIERRQDAVAVYQSVQKTIADESQGRKFGAQDRGNSIAIADLLEKGFRHEAAEKLTEWELEHPMAKFDSDFLLLRGRVLMTFGRWREALQEIESFGKMNPDSPYQIPADFYGAQAMWQLGRKEEARKLWQNIAKQYPKHELARESERLGNQP